MDQIDLSTKNVKLSCKIRLLQNDNISFNTDKCLTKFYPNFCVIKSKFTYIIFTKKKQKDSTFHVNITKIPNLYYVQEAIKNLTNIIKEKHAIENEHVENLTCFYYAPQFINLRHIFEKFNFTDNNYVIAIRYRPEKFPGMFINFKKCTVLLFSNGKLVVIGASNEADAKTGILHVLKLVQKLQT